MEKFYNMSRIILTVITVIVFKIMFINEHESWNIIPYIFGVIVFGLSFPSSIISKKLIYIANKIENKMLKVLYYILGLPLICVIIFAGICFIIISVYNNAPTSNEMGAALSQALVFLFFVTVAFVGIILPYVQTVIVLILKCFMKKQ